MKFKYKITKSVYVTLLVAAVALVSVGINKMKIVEEECDETIYWLEIIEESGLAKIEVVTPLKREAKEILAMIVASINTMSKNLKSKKSEI